jgi:predicted O-methyltransferase YrrM
MSRFDHWTAAYVFNRSLDILSNFAHPQWPWLTPKAVRILEHSLKPSDKVFEWGSGRSTLWLARRVSFVASIEHDPIWFEKVRLRAERLNLSNITLQFVARNARGEDEHDSGGSAYIAPLYEFEHGFDLILVDGVYRGRCALAATHKLKPGGMVVVDNANWYLPCSSRAPGSRTETQGAISHEWTEFKKSVSGWQVLWTSNGVTDTAIWVAPDDSRKANVEGQTRRGLELSTVDFRPLT